MSRASYSRVRRPSRLDRTLQRDLLERIGARSRDGRPRLSALSPPPGESARRADDHETALPALEESRPTSIRRKLALAPDRSRGCTKHAATGRTSSGRRSASSKSRPVTNGSICCSTSGTSSSRSSRTGPAPRRRTWLRSRSDPTTASSWHEADAALLGGERAGRGSSTWCHFDSPTSWRTRSSARSTCTRRPSSRADSLARPIKPSLSMRRLSSSIRRSRRRSTKPSSFGRPRGTTTSSRSS